MFQKIIKVQLFLFGFFLLQVSKHDLGSEAQREALGCSA